MSILGKLFYLNRVLVLLLRHWILSYLCIWSWWAPGDSPLFTCRHPFWENRKNSCAVQDHPVQGVHAVVITKGISLGVRGRLAWLTPSSAMTLQDQVHHLRHPAQNGNAGLLFKYYKSLQDDDDRVTKPTSGPSECRLLQDCTGCQVG